MSNLPKTSIFARFKTNRTAEEDGKWIDLGGGLKVKIRRFLAKKSAEVRDELEKPYRARGGKVTIPPDVLKDITYQHIAKGILVDWEGVFDNDGSEIKYTADTAYKLMTELPDLATIIVQEAIDFDNFKDEEKKETAGN